MFQLQLKFTENQKIIINQICLNAKINKASHLSIHNLDPLVEDVSIMNQDNLHLVKKLDKISELLNKKNVAVAKNKLQLSSLTTNSSNIRHQVASMKPWYKPSEKKKIT